MPATKIQPVVTRFSQASRRKPNTDVKKGENGPLQ